MEVPHFLPDAAHSLDIPDAEKSAHRQIVLPTFVCSARCCC